ncbi:hypothetical protein OBBRIDRAFT_839864 [Obba rivulosa]|uniref:Uncharacterized protein n=1 Tax=Obba rivulosa TaxID=1052685 RepID=A0A8E2AP83_9APHY|nr:hypothetical protein OBBRIDRAFT_839864 [Obba rivulosa]
MSRRPAKRQRSPMPQAEGAGTPKRAMTLGEEAAVKVSFPILLTLSAASPSPPVSPLVAAMPMATVAIATTGEGETVPGTVKEAENNRADGPNQTPRTEVIVGPVVTNGTLTQGVSQFFELAPKQR